MSAEALAHGLDPRWHRRRLPHAPQRRGIQACTAAAGHLYVYIGVQEHPFFERADEHLLYTLQMNPAQAALAEASIPTLGDKDKTLKIPPGTQSGRVFTLKGED